MKRLKKGSKMYMKGHDVQECRDKWQYQITANNWISPLIKACNEYSDPPTKNQKV